MVMVEVRGGGFTTALLEEDGNCVADPLLVKEITAVF